MLKKLILVMTIILTLFIIGPKKEDEILVAEEDDAIEWNSYETQDNLS